MTTTAPSKAVSAAVLDKIEKIVSSSHSVDRDILMALAEAYSFNALAEQARYFQLYDLMQKAQVYRKSFAANIQKDSEAALSQLLGYALETDHPGQNDPNRRNTSPGFSRVLRRSVQEKYVIFSDLYLTDRRNQTQDDFFYASGNMGLYQEVLKQYARDEYTLVENGNVEGLLITDPTPDDVEYRHQLLSGAQFWQQLDAYREMLRAEQLKKVILANSDYYAQIREDFIENGKYVRIAGSQDPYRTASTQRILRSRLLDVTVQDSLVLQDDGLAPQYVITHGHQFDPYFHPRTAGKVGETIEEILGWLFQGPNRIWNWEMVVQLLKINKSVGNQLVEEQNASSDTALFSGRETSAKVLEAIGRVVRQELALGRPISWAGFANADPWQAMLYEVMGGKALPQVEVVNERMLWEHYAKYFSTSGLGHPILITGHTHTPRFNPVNSDGQQWPQYLNCGSAGRYENLIWGVEILAGKPALISWHSEDGPVHPGSGRRPIPVRTVWESEGAELVPKF